MTKLEEDIDAVAAKREALCAAMCLGKVHGVEPTSDDFARVKAETVAIRNLKGNAIAALGIRPTRNVSIKGRSVAIEMPVEPYVEESNGTLHVRVMVREGVTYRGIGIQKARDEHIEIRNPPTKVASGKKIQEVLPTGETIDINEMIEDFGAAIDSAIERALNAIGVFDDVEIDKGNSTLISYPDAGAGPTGGTIDGYIFASNRIQTFNLVIATANTVTEVTTASPIGLLNSHSSVSDRFSTHSMGALTFDTDIGGETPNTVTLGLRGTGKSNSFDTDTDIVLCSATLGANDQLALSDYTAYDTELAAFSYANWSTSGFNVFNLQPGDINNSGITQFATCLRWTLDGTFGATWEASKSTSYNCRMADNAGTDEDPVVTIQYGALPPSGAGASIAAPAAAGLVPGLKI